MYYGWSKEFLEASKRLLAGDTARAATSGEVKDLRREAAALGRSRSDPGKPSAQKTYGPAPSARGLIRLKEIVVDWAALVTNIKPKREHPTFRVRLALGFATSLSCNATS
ncbi:hypothetical protein ACVIWV_009800 [Bradyrhizobium diazoefficiens]|nr:ISCc3, transposase OrfA [Bradyrhizobium diazoefficiens]GLR92479.1 hypothetical protein GCM10007858_00970 [Bradyrhizobium liaoningense]